MTIKEHVLELYAKAEGEYLEEAENAINEMPKYKEVEDIRRAAESAFFEKLQAKAPELCEEFRELENAFFDEEMEFAINMYRLGFIKAWDFMDRQ